ncbi:MAG: hypothetical protein JWM80_5297 [Cyanobacteria bacterium RYN_339]|nr:hypothetical protein [Cyanobacteria bacterium RYN_339]
MVKFKTRARSGFTLIEILVVVIIIGVMGSISVANFNGMRDSSNNNAIYANLKQVSVALEQYRTDWSQLPLDIYGANSNFLCDTSINAQRRYLSANHLPTTPFSPSYQNNNLPSALTPAALIVAANPGATLKALRNSVVISPGTAPLTLGPANAFLLTDYGAFFYSVNPTGRDLYVISGLGRRGRASIVVDALTNAI